MKNSISKSEKSVLILTLCFLCNDSWGYIEPSSGYILWQVLFGVLAGLMFFAKRIWLICKTLFSKERTENTPQS
ncbi:MAG: hypothetical protein EBR01_04800 [Proteobacteria bacterium]|nr:hypothetical protein [Pseudomonadota bacterium]NBY19653.1 hypothetical protein [bacterium]